MYYVTVNGKVYQEFRTKKEALACAADMKRRGMAKHIVKVDDAPRYQPNGLTPGGWMTDEDGYER